MKRLFILALAGAASVALAQEIKAPNDIPPVRGDVPPATGGPDTFGYVYADSTTAQCAFDFVDITASGTSVVSGDDTSAAVTCPDRRRISTVRPSRILPSAPTAICRPTRPTPGAT